MISTGSAAATGQSPKQMRMLTASDGMQVPYERIRNKPGENHGLGTVPHPPDGHSSWRGYWEVESGMPWPEVCPVQNTLFKTDSPGIFRIRPCDEEIAADGIGGRVQLVDEDDEPVDDTVHIVPLCKWHNEVDRNELVLDIDNLLLVKAPANDPQLSFA